MGAKQPALSVPAAAVLMRDGKQAVFVVGADNRVADKPVAVGHALPGEHVAILEGLSPEDKVVASGGGFLSPGDLVSVEAGRK